MVAVESAQVLGRPVFSVDGEEYRWEDVLLAAHAWGEWAKLSSRAAEGVACARRVEVEGDPLAQDDVSSAAKAFRYEHGLLSGDEMEAWLEQWGLDVTRWMASINRSLLREHWATDLKEIASRFPAPAEEIRDAVWVDAIGSGALTGFAWALAARAAAHSALGGSPARDGESSSRTALLDESFRRFREQAVTSEALANLAGAREMDWLLVTCRSLTLPDEGMAREAALLVRSDGMALAEVAQQAGLTVHDVAVYLEDIEPPLKDMVFSAGEGELLGPVPDGERFLLVTVDAKTRPSVEDPAIRERAQSEVARRAVDQEVINRVRWHERVGSA